MPIQFPGPLENLLEFCGGKGMLNNNTSGPDLIIIEFLRKSQIKQAHQKLKRHEARKRAMSRYQDLRRSVFARDGFKCRHCGGNKWLSLDHVIPKRAGGSNHPDNLQCLCHSCNSKKVKTDREQFPQ